MGNTAVERTDWQLKIPGTETLPEPNNELPHVHVCTHTHTHTDPEPTDSVKWISTLIFAPWRMDNGIQRRTLFEMKTQPVLLRKQCGGLKTPQESEWIGTLSPSSFSFWGGPLWGTWPSNVQLHNQVCCYRLRIVYSMLLYTPRTKNTCAYFSAHFQLTLPMF